MALLPAYHYTSLESHHDDSNDANIPSTHFRLLVLDGGEPTDEVSCSLEQYCLASAPDYEAISYVWGDPTETCDIICSGQQLAVTKSLHSACVDFAWLVKSARFGQMQFASINGIWENEVLKYRSWARSIRRLAVFLSGWERRPNMTLKPSMSRYSLRQFYQHLHLP